MVDWCWLKFVLQRSKRCLFIFGDLLLWSLVISCANRSVWGFPRVTRWCTRWRTFIGDELEILRLRVFYSLKLICVFAVRLIFWVSLNTFDLKPRHRTWWWWVGVGDISYFFVSEGISVMRIGCRSLSRSWQMTALQRHLVGHTVAMQRFLRKQRKLGDLQRSSDTSTTRSNLLIQFSRANCLRELPMCLTFLYFSMLHDDETQFSHKSNSTTYLACVSWAKRSHLMTPCGTKFIKIQILFLSWDEETNDIFVLPGTCPGKLRPLGLTPSCDRNCKNLHFRKLE